MKPCLGFCLGVCKNEVIFYVVCELHRLGVLVGFTCNVKGEFNSFGYVCITQIMLPVLMV